MQTVSLAEKFAGITDYWSPRIAGELNGQHIRLVKLLGDFIWHHHDDQDELFLAVKGSFRLEYRDETGVENSLDVHEGEFVIVPRGVEHRPRAEHEAEVLLFEPAATRNTGNVISERTVEVLQPA